MFLQNFSALPDAAIPKVLSTSYGDSEDTVDYAYASRVGLEFQKLGARGVTVRDRGRVCVCGPVLRWHLAQE